MDTLIVDDVRNFLVGPPGAGGFDLASLNLQRGRDHGPASYNHARVDYALAPAATFADISSNPDVQAALPSVYDTPDDVDLWVGGLAEGHYPGALVGELIRTILADQFTRLRVCNLYWYENNLIVLLLFGDFVPRQTLARLHPPQQGDRLRGPGQGLPAPRGSLATGRGATLASAGGGSRPDESSHSEPSGLLHGVPGVLGVRRPRGPGRRRTLGRLRATAHEGAGTRRLRGRDQRRPDGSPLLPGRLPRRADGSRRGVPRALRHARLDTAAREDGFFHGRPAGRGARVGRERAEWGPPVVGEGVREGHGAGGSSAARRRRSRAAGRG